MGFDRKHLLGLEDLSVDEISTILQNAKGFKSIFTRTVKKVPALRGKTVVNLFYEPSTRTRISFELAAKRLSADVINFSVSTSSVKKGESLLDTVRTIEALASDIVVIRHGAPGCPHMLSKNVRSSIVNAGDGPHEHPTQALLDLFTIQEIKGRVEGLNVTIVGDIGHSRVARSNIWGLLKLGANVTLVGPPTLVSETFTKWGVRVCYNLDDGLKNADVVNILRLQFERQQDSLLPSIREYINLYGITKQRLAKAKDDVLIMHPGPTNRGVEIAEDVQDSAQSAILQQVTNGVAIRMAVLYLVSGGKERYEF